MEYLYINDQYCANPEELKTLLTDPGNQKSKQFRNEVLAFFRDGILGKWCEQHGIAMQYSDINDTDDKAFKKIVKAITGKEVSGNLSSKFNEIGEFIRAEIEGQSYTISDGKIEVVINEEQTSTPIKFVFKCLKSENNEYAFTLGNQTISKNWKDFNKGEEVVYEFSKQNKGTHILKEGDNNTICVVNINLIPFDYYAKLCSNQIFELDPQNKKSVDVKFQLKKPKGPNFTIEIGNEKQILKLNNNSTQTLHFSPKEFKDYEVKCNGKKIGKIVVKEKESYNWTYKQKTIQFRYCGKNRKNLISYEGSNCTPKEAIEQFKEENNCNNKNVYVSKDRNGSDKYTESDVKEAFYYFVLEPKN